MALWDVLPLAASDLAIVGISAGAALLGGVLGALAGGLISYRLEQDRQKHERELEQQRYEREQATRVEQDRSVARGLGRVLINDLIVAEARLRSELDGDAWNDEAAWTPSLEADDRRDLFRYLRRSEFLAVIAAEGWLTILDAHRKTLRGLDDPDRTVKPPNLDADYKEALEKVEKARNALQRLSIEGQEFDPE